MAKKINGNKKYFSSKETAEKVAKERGHYATAIGGGQYYVANAMETQKMRTSLKLISSKSSKHDKATPAKQPFGIRTSKTGKKYVEVRPEHTDKDKRKKY